MDRGGAGARRGLREGVRADTTGYALKLHFNRLQGGWCSLHGPVCGKGRCNPSHRPQEEGPEPLAAAEGDGEVLGGAAWTPLFSSAAEQAKYQVAGGWAVVGRHAPEGPTTFDPLILFCSLTWFRGTSFAAMGPRLPCAAALSRVYERSHRAVPAPASTGCR